MSASAAPSTDDHPASRAARIRGQARDRSQRWRARKAVAIADMAAAAAKAEALLERAEVDGAVLTALVKLHMAKRDETGDAGVALPLVDIVREAKAILVDGGRSRDWASDTVRHRLRLEAEAATAAGFPGRWSVAPAHQLYS